MPDLLPALRQHLIANNVVRQPSVAGSKPPMWLEPMRGTPAPGETPPAGTAVEVGTSLVIAAYITGGVAPQPFGSWERRPIIELRFRGTSPKEIEQTELAITGLVIDRRDWTMGGLYVLESGQWRALQRVQADEQGYEFLSAYWFQLLRP